MTTIQMQYPTMTMNSSTSGKTLPGFRSLNVSCKILMLDLMKSGGKDRDVALKCRLSSYF